MGLTSDMCSLFLILRSREAGWRYWDAFNLVDICRSMAQISHTYSESKVPVIQEALRFSKGLRRCGASVSDGPKIRKICFENTACYTPCIVLSVYLARAFVHFSFPLLFLYTSLLLLHFRACHLFRGVTSATYIWPN